MASVSRLFEAKPRPPVGTKFLVLVDRGGEGAKSVMGIFSSVETLENWFFANKGYYWHDVDGVEDPEEALRRILDGTSAGDLEVEEMVVDPAPER